MWVMVWLKQKIIVHEVKFPENERYKRKQWRSRLYHMRQMNTASFIVLTTRPRANDRIHWNLCFLHLKNGNNNPASSVP